MRTYTTKEEPIRDVIRVCYFWVPGRASEDAPTETYVRVGALPKELREAVRSALQPLVEEREREAQQRALRTLPRDSVEVPSSNVAAQIHNESGFDWKAPEADSDGSG